jgi:hypothetical protein
MGGHAYFYFVPYQNDLQRALDELREREFKAGRYNPVLPFIKFREPAFSRQSPGAKHKTIKAAVKASAEDGTRSILDISKVGDRSDYGIAGPLSLESVEDLYGTTQPTREMVEDDLGFLEDVERGKCVYVVLYKNGDPSEVCFAGYSYD